MRRNGAASRAHPLCVEDEMSRRTATIGANELHEVRQQRRRREIRHLNQDARNSHADDEPGLCGFRTVESRVYEQGARSIAAVNADGERGGGASASHVCTHGYAPCNEHVNASMQREGEDDAGICQTDSDGLTSSVRHRLKSSQDFGTVLFSPI